MLCRLPGLLPVIAPLERRVISGALTETGCAGAHEKRHALMAEAPMPWHAIPGTHDSRQNMRAFAALADWMPHAIL